MIPRLALSSRKQFVVLLLQTAALVGEGGHRAINAALSPSA
jgi:hypothetical protein